MGKRILTLQRLATDLPKVLEFARLDRDYLIIVDHEAHYVQLAFPDGWILGEAVSNEYLGGEWRLDQHQEVMLDILGWERPHAVDRDGCCHSNFHRAWHDDTPSDDIARDVLDTLVGVYLRDEAAVVGLDVFWRGRQEDGTPYEGFGACDIDAVA